MNTRQMTRQDFLGVTASWGLMTLVGCLPLTCQGVIVYRRLGKGRHVSNAAKKYNANRLYLTQQAATLDLPHAGDHSKVDMVMISSVMFLKLFSGGKLIADLRHDL